VCAIERIADDSTLHQVEWFGLDQSNQQITVRYYEQGFSSTALSITPLVTCASTGTPSAPVTSCVASFPAGTTFNTTRRNWVEAEITGPDPNQSTLHIHTISVMYTPPASPAFSPYTLSSNTCKRRSELDQAPSTFGQDFNSSHGWNVSDPTWVTVHCPAALTHGEALSTVFNDHRDASNDGAVMGCLFERTVLGSVTDIWSVVGCCTSSGTVGTPSTVCSVGFSVTVDFPQKMYSMVVQFYKETNINNLRSGDVQISP
jgi:hypothetical protein